MTSAADLFMMIIERADIVYEALRTRPQDQTLRKKYEKLVNLCDAKRSYEVPPEYSGILHIERRHKWSPTDLEVARVLVSSTVSCLDESVAYGDLVNRLYSIMLLEKPHLYRSLKVILRHCPGRGGRIEGIRLR
jgi:hypothetical protein